MRLEGIEPSYQAWKASVMAIILQSRINIFMSNLNEGNLYNVEQIVSSNGKKDQSKIGISHWKNEVRKQLMQKLQSYSPEYIERIISATFSDNLK